MSSVGSVRSVKIVSDSACDLPAALRERWNVRTVPVYVTFGQETYRDGADISPSEMLARLGRGEYPRFSQPAPWDFVQTYRSLAEEETAVSGQPSSIISIHVTAELSGTVNSALLARELCPELEITVVDSRTGSMGAGWIVLEAARSAAAGVPPDEVMRQAKSATRRGAFFLLVPDLTFLHRAGRLGKAQAWLGQTLSVAPVLSVRAGVVAPYRLARGRAPALRALLAAAMAHCGRCKQVRAAVIHVGAEAEGEALMLRAREAMPIVESLVVHAGATVTGALGPGTIGLCVLRGEEPQAANV
ncbi:MAG: DegV family protein [Bacillota bacterium]|nr:DegV family protein [Bacillota bacterium]